MFVPARAGLISNSLECVDSYGEPCFDPVEDNWYEVHDWEIDVCRKWGGPENMIKGTSTYSNFVSQLTATIQAEKDVLDNDTIVYKYSYFVMPFDVSKANYSIYFESGNFSGNVSGNISRKHFVVNQTTVTAENGASDYKVFESNKSFDRITMDLYDEGKMTVPVMVEDYEPSCEGCGFQEG